MYVLSVVGEAFLSLEYADKNLTKTTCFRFNTFNQTNNNEPE